MKSTRFASVSLIVSLFTIHSQTAFSQGAKPPVRGEHGMVVSSHYLASEVGVEVLKQGGNAVDAAVATGLALAVVHPAAGNIGGGGFMIVYTNKGEVTAFDFREKAPLAAHENMYLDKNGKYVEDLEHEGCLAIGVPGTVAGFDLALKRFGKKKLKELIAPAISLAERGFKLSYAAADEFAAYKRDWKKYPSSGKIFFKHDTTTYKAGETWKQPALAKTLKRIQQNGKDGFYKGETAKRIADDMKMHGGLITEEDLALYQARERTPIHGTYRGYDVYSMCPPSSGGVTLVQMLNVLEGYDLQAMGHNSAAYIHTVVEAMRRGFANRAQWLGDPEFNPDMPVERLISKEYAAALRKSIRPDTASPSVAERFAEAYESPQTTHYSVVDAEGNAVVVTYTLEYGYGSRIVAEGLGFLYNNEMGDFNPWPGHTDEEGNIGSKPNLVQPRKTMLSSMTPTIVAKEGKPYLLLGSPGGRTIINTVLQVVLNVLDFNMNMAQANAAGRFHHEWLPDVIRMERYATTKDTRDKLEAMGYKFKFYGQGSVMAILIDPKAGMRLGSADPRASDGGAVGY